MASAFRPKKCNRPVADPETSPHSIAAREKNTVVSWVEISPSNGFFKTIGFFCKDKYVIKYHASADNLKFLYTSVSRKVVGKKCARDNPER